MYARAPAQSPRLRVGRLAAPADATLAEGMQRLDAAQARSTLAGCRLCAFGAWLDGRLIAVASLYHEPRPGSPWHDVYRIADVVVRTEDAATDAAAVLIARCAAHTARTGGRTLWVDAPVGTVPFWRRCGFSIAGPAWRPRGGKVQVPMVQSVRPTHLRAL